MNEAPNNPDPNEDDESRPNVGINTLQDAIRNIDKGPLPQEQMNPGDFKLLQQIEARLQALHGFLNTGGISFTEQHLRDSQRKVEGGYLSPEEIAQINHWREEVVKMFQE